MPTQAEYNTGCQVKICEATQTVNKAGAKLDFVCRVVTAAADRKGQDASGPAGKGPAPSASNATK